MTTQKLESALAAKRQEVAQIEKQIAELKATPPEWALLDGKNLWGKRGSEKQPVLLNRWFWTEPGAGVIIKSNCDCSEYPPRWIYAPVQFPVYVTCQSWSEDAYARYDVPQCGHIAVKRDGTERAGISNYAIAEQFIKEGTYRIITEAEALAMVRKEEEWVDVAYAMDDGYYGVPINHLESLGIVTDNDCPVGEHSRFMGYVHADGTIDFNNRWKDGKHATAVRIRREGKK